MASRDGAGGKIRVVVAAASPVRRGGLEAIVRADASLHFSGSVSVLLGLNSQLRTFQPNVVMVDLSHSESELPSIAAALEQTDISVVALIDEPNSSWAARALRSGVRSILPRDSSAPEIISAIHAANRGLVLLDPELARELGRLSRPNPAGSTLENLEELTPREIEVLRLLAEGLGNKEVASRLGISDHTVKFHISSILAKLGAGTRTEAVTIGIRMGLVLL
jgi:two-component system, NarL family, response regulator YdfI